ncbi:MAG: PEP-CTERM system histidine kinase PrsK, partial [Gammaproteobacteria bacterium]
QAWLVVPLFHREALLGFAVLARPRAPRELNWEDYDLLRTAGRQVASHLAQEQASEALAQARQMEAFGRLSAFVVHDLKNVAAQLRLVVANAERHRHNPAFVEDAMRTVGHAADKMERLLAQLRAGREATREPAVRVDLEALLERVAERAAGRRPVPEVEVQDGGLQAVAAAERLADVVGHLVQNAQEATPPDGRVVLRLRREGAEAVMEVEDTGCGMDEAFVRERLFKPFDSTKGREGMGIGAFEARAFVQASGGRLEVRSRPGEGTSFRIRLPLAGTAARRAAQGA